MAYGSVKVNTNKAKVSSKGKKFGPRPGGMPSFGFGKSAMKGRKVTPVKYGSA